MAAAAAGCLQRRAAYRFTDILLGLTAATTGQQAAEPAGPTETAPSAIQTVTILYTIQNNILQYQTIPTISII